MNENIYYPSEVRRVLEIAAEMEKMEKTISEIKGDCEAARVIKHIKTCAVGFKSCCEKDNLSADDYLYSKDKTYEEGCREAEEALRMVKKVYSECSEILLQKRLKEVWEEVESMWSQFNQEYENSVAGSKNRTSAYGHMVQLQRIKDNIKSVIKNADGEDKRLKRIDDIRRTLKECRKYKNTLNGVLF